MSISCMLSVSLGVLLLLTINGCFASLPIEQAGVQLAWLQGSAARLAQDRQRHPLRFRSECPLETLNTLEPSRRIDGEAGYSEVWDVNNEQLVCAGSAVLRHVIRRRGLFLPSYTTTSELLYVLQGSGVHGVVIPGCRDTYQSAESEWSDFEGESRRRGERHQKVREIKEGDVIGLPGGLTHWIHNDAESDLILLSILYTASEGNQLDESIRKFFLAGNTQHGGGSFGGRRHRHGGQEEGESFGNIFRGFDEDLLSQTYNVETELARRLRGEDDQRGHIIEVQDDLQIVRPAEQEEEEIRRWESENENGIEETICSFRLKENIDNPVRADFYNPRAGRITALTSFSLPILAHLHLSADKGVLYKDAIVGPHFYPNSNALVYVIRGRARVQIVGESGNTVFDGEVQERQLLTVPQGFVVVKKAGSEGLEWISIRTNDVAVVNPLAGRLSVFRTLPEDVIVNAYGVSKQDARDFKYNREELAIFSPTTTQGSTTRTH